LRENANDEKREQDNGEGIVHDRMRQPLHLGPIFTFLTGIAARPRQFPGPDDGSHPTVPPFMVG
jgi:hypothetical protein